MSLRQCIYWERMQRFSLDGVQVAAPVPWVRLCSFFENGEIIHSTGMERILRLLRRQHFSYMVSTRSSGVSQDIFGSVSTQYVEQAFNIYQAYELACTILLYFQLTSINIITSLGYRNISEGLRISPIAFKY